MFTVIFNIFLNFLNENKLQLLDKNKIILLLDILE